MSDYIIVRVLDTVLGYAVCERLTMPPDHEETLYYQERARFAEYRDAMEFITVKEVP